MFNIDFDSKALQFIHHPRFQKEAERILPNLQHLNSHFLLFSSGTTSSAIKGYAISRKALLNNARAVNQHFNLSSHDIWGLSLPYYHIGGLSILARAYELKSSLVDCGIWNPEEWTKLISKKLVTITTLVPAQIYDLVDSKLSSPPTLKYLVVGGDYLSHELERKALELGWPIIRTFGMTEVSSQLASASTPGGDLEVLPIHQVKIHEDERLWVKSSSLFTLQFVLRDDELEITEAQSLLDSEGFYPTSDIVSLDQGFTHQGRLDDQLKVQGRLISLLSLREKLASYALSNDLYGKLEMILEPDERSGKRIILLHLPDFYKSSEIQALFSPLKIFFREVESFQRTDLGKLKRT
jgi:O-succinylbenzoic acid--CoA ligase